MAKLRDEGYVVDVVQRSIPTKPYPTSKDLYGIGDLIAIAADHTLLVQVCRDEDLTDHLVTCLHEPNTAKWIACQDRAFEIWHWAKKNNRWRERRLEAVLVDGSVRFVEFSVGRVDADSREKPMDGVQTSARDGR